MAAHDLPFGPKLRCHKVTADENNIPPGTNVINNVPTRVIVSFNVVVVSIVVRVVGISIVKAS